MRPLKKERVKMSIDDVRLIEFSVDQIDGMKRVDAINAQMG